MPWRDQKAFTGGREVGDWRQVFVRWGESKDGEVQGGVYGAEAKSASIGR